MIKKMSQSDLDKIDYLILQCIVNSDETEADIIKMVDRLNNCRFAAYYYNIQHPCPVGDKTDTINLHRDDEE